MENYETIDNVEIFDEVDNAVTDSENFPAKDRGRTAARRKKDYFKGKRRYERICDVGWEPDNPRILRGKLKKTHVIRPTIWRNSDTYRFDTKRSTIRRSNEVDNKLMDYELEDSALNAGVD